MSGIKMVTNPLLEHYVGVIRDVRTDKNEFARSIENILYLMSKDITSHVGTEKRVVSSPLAETEVAYFSDKILLIPILRAGMSMLEPLKKIIPLATFGYVGISRSQEENGEFKANVYYCNLPPNLHEFKVYILEVVVATGSTVKYAINHLLEAGVAEDNISIVSIISSKVGLDVLLKLYPRLSVFTCAIDSHLNDHGYIVPGLGDAGNRYNGYDC